MNTSAITSKRNGALAANSLSIFHKPQFSQSSTECGAVCLPGTVSKIGLANEVSFLFQGYYQAFVGYPTDNYQLPAKTSVRYTLRRHSGTHFWESPAFKAGVTGFGSVLTAFSVGFLLSDSFTTPLASEPLAYSVPPDLVAGVDSESVVAEPADEGASVVADRPSMISPIEFSQPHSK